MTQQYSDFQRIWRLGRILQHNNIPMWTCEDKHGNWIYYRRDREKLIEYEPAALRHMQNLQKILLMKWNSEHPTAIKNGRNKQ